MEIVERHLNCKKYSFLSDVESSIDAYIRSTGKNCIALVEKSTDGTILRRWELHMDDDIHHYAKVLYHFVRNKPPTHRGNDLDSALTGPITELVEKKWAELYANESDSIATGVMQSLIANEVALKSFMDRISEIALTAASEKAKEKVIEEIIDQITEAVHSGAIDQVGQQISHLAMTTAGTQIAAAVAQLLIKLMATHITHIVAKVLASSVIKTAIKIMAKKIIGAAVLGVVANFLWVHFGVILTGSSLMFVVIPIVVGIIGYKVITFPEKLGKKVSEKVRGELDDQYEELNNTILTQIFKQVVEGDELAQSISEDCEFKTILSKLAKDHENKRSSTLIKSRGSGFYSTSVSVREIH